MTDCQAADQTGCPDAAVAVHITGCTYTEHINRVPWCPSHSAQMETETTAGLISCVQCWHDLRRFSKVRLLKVEPV